MTSMAAFVIFAALCSVAAAYDVPELTKENYDILTEGKTVFLKFYAPWCHHCRMLAPTWKKLAEGWEGDRIGYVAQVDCVGEGSDLCEVNDVRAYPTLMYGDPTNLEEYNGGRTFEQLVEFSKENLVTLCSPKNVHLCTDEKRAAVENLLAMSKEELKAKIEAEEQRVKKADKEFEAVSKKLQNQFKEAQKKRESADASLKNSIYEHAKSILKAKQNEIIAAEQLLVNS